MKRCIAAVLLVLSLEALAAGRLSAAVADDRVDTIRLPSNGLADEVATAATEKGAEKKRPWKCCDSPLCSRSIPPRCRCMDAVERCDEACTRCEASQSDPSRRICVDRYNGWPGPNCTKPDGNGDISSGVAGRGDATAAAEKNEAAGERPWECCDLALCTRSWPPMCRCVDQVEQCAATCKSCEPVTSGSSRLVCNDWYHGFPGPNCMKVGAAKPDDDDVNGDGEVSSEVAGHHEAAAQMAVSEENSVVDGEKPRPWKCCDDTLCTRSAPPTCACNDKVRKCAKTCKKCEKDESDASRFVCRDRYFGWPGPKCTEI